MSKKVLEKRTCPHCGKEFTPNHARRKFCSDSHRISHFNKRKGYKVMRIAPEDQKPMNGIQVAGQNKTPAEQDFNAGNVGASMVGTIAGMKLYEIFTKDENKAASNAFVKQSINTLYQAIETANQKRYEEILKRLDKGKDLSNVL